MGVELTLVGARAKECPSLLFSPASSAKVRDQSQLKCQVASGNGWIHINNATQPDASVVVADVDTHWQLLYVACN